MNRAVKESLTAGTPAVRERPILFSAPMVRAILEGRKTQTRRVVKPRGGGALGVRRDATCRVTRPGEWSFGVDGPRGWSSLAEPFSCPYGAPGDRLWAKEKWALSLFWEENSPSSVPVCYPRDIPVWWAADGATEESINRGRWRPSIYMPRWASRITLEVTGVRVERLHDISEEDAIAEGISRHAAGWTDGTVGYDTVTARQAYRELWESINGLGSWEADPWVWVVEFERCREAA